MCRRECVALGCCFTFFSFTPSTSHFYCESNQKAKKREMTDLERGNAEAVRLTNEEERKSDNEQTCYTKEELEGTFLLKF